MDISRKDTELDFIIVSAFGLKKELSASQRIRSLLNGLASIGRSPYFVTFKEDEILETLNHEGISVITIKPSLMARIIKFIINKLKKENDRPVSFEERDTVLFGIYIYFFLHGYLLPFFRTFFKSVSLIKLSLKNRKKPVLITSVPPALYHLIGVLSKLIFKNRIVWVADFQDPISNSPFLKQTNSFLFRFTDRMAWKNLDLAIVPFEVLRQFLIKTCSKYVSNIESKIFFLPKGVEKNPTNKKMTGKKLRVFYGGSLYKSQSIGFERLIEAAKNMNDVEIVYAGPSYPFVRFLGSKYQASFLKVNKTLPYDDFLKKAGDSDVLLVISTFFENITFFGGKIFDYLSFDKPILVITPKNQEIDMLSQMAGGIYCVDADADKIRETLENIRMLLKTKKTFRKESFYRDYSHSSQARRLVELIDQFLSVSTPER